MKNEIASGQEHENNNDQLDHGVVVGDTVIFSRKPARGDRGKRMANCVKGLHAAEKEQDRFHKGQSAINQQQDLSGAGDTGREAYFQGNLQSMEEVHGSGKEGDGQSHSETG